ncbi:hypothetical protein TEA_008803 [Camellia sinensis var. sinensis]|uniref:PPM-type phosphatase domain-containing protein n=1 Tax=Camellia sinensis var. sinensis TaxID=542762 RepID=A0A4S4DLT5_CAMSN|nr:hypothetical protein TEA_008803 [Camellia sinensis var. sinensis]
MSAIPQGIGRQEWLQALPRGLVAGFVKTDIEFQQKGMFYFHHIRETSGTTVTFVVIDGWTVTVASVGDSRCILDTQGGVVSLLTVDHRLEENAEERERVTASGGEVGRLNVFGGNEVGPLRCWPGGLCLSRSIGDTDVGEFIVPIPHVKQRSRGRRRQGQTTTTNLFSSLADDAKARRPDVRARLGWESPTTGSVMALCVTTGSLTIGSVMRTRGM